MKGRHTFNTEDGQVMIEVRGDQVLVSESLDRPTTEIVEQDVWGR